MSHTLGWLKFSRRLLVVHFEKLRADLLSQLQLIMSFLNTSISEDRLLCAESNRDGLFKRSGPRKPTFDPYTPQMRMLIDSYIFKVDQALRDRNFRGLPKEYMPRWRSQCIPLHSKSTNLYGFLSVSGLTIAGEIIINCHCMTAKSA